MDLNPISWFVTRKKAMKTLILSLISLVFANNLFAQEQWLHFTNDSEITAMAIENDTLWAGTKGGLLKWNLVDSTYEKFLATDGLADNYVTSIAIGSNNTKWIGTGKGISKFDGSNWTSYNSLNSGLIYNYVTDIAFDVNGDVWISTENGVSMFDGTNWINYDSSNSGLSNNNVNSILIDSSGNKWFGIYTGGVSKFDGTNWINYDSSNSGLINNNCYSIEQDASNNIWIGTGSGVSKFDGLNWTSYTIFNSNLVSNTIQDISIDKEGNLWFVTLNGASKFNGTSWQNFIESNSGLISSTINSVISDSDGNVYFGQGFFQQVGGISSFDGINWKNFETPKTLTDNSVRKILIDSNGNKWFGNGYGINKLSGETWEKIYGYGNVFPNLGAIDSDGDIWFGSWNSLAEYNGTNWTYYDETNSGFPSNFSLEAMEIDGNNNIWISNGNENVYGNGVTRFNGTNWDSFDTSNSGLISDDIYSIKKDIDGSVWFGGQDGVTNFDGTNWATINFTFPYTARVLSIGIEQNTKWFGTLMQGVRSYDGNTWTYYDSTNSGLPSNKVLVIEIDNLGNKWFGTDNGLCKFDGTNWTVFNKANGDLISDYIYTLASDDFGNLWIGYEGLSIFNENGVVLGVEEIKPDFSPKDFNLSQNYPNPFNPTTTIEYSIPENSFVKLEIFNVLGQKVRTLVSETKIAGKHLIKWTGTNELKKQVSSGVYFYKITANDFVENKKMLFLK
ncbi:MAG: T9SS C-terminal target domain-containing protein [Calditrichaeota bacterium]|nr:MAG: T9SS C-terminal target domain-containing protein [Calditrichota bacterium]